MPTQIDGVRVPEGTGGESAVQLRGGYAMEMTPQTVGYGGGQSEADQSERGKLSQL